MMYNHKLAVALKSAGNVLREFGETVYIPFGNEYSVLIKNLNSVRALVKVEIDGEDVGDGTKFIVDPNSDLELERFIKNHNLKNGNSFRFIERTSNIEDHRGIGVGDGLIRIEFNFERVFNIAGDLWNNGNNHWNSGSWNNNNTGHLRNLKTFASNNLIGNTTNYSANIKGTAASADVVNTNLNDAGITVPGSVSQQEFKDGTWFPTEIETHVIVLQMLGQTEDNQQVIKPVTVRAKLKCSTCGRTNKANAKFCTECGTSLTIV